ncbi:hypothetical protein GS446_24010 [Rhodococcus hoagii]|nr:hypothetical protein [Prescottella equi]
MTLNPSVPSTGTDVQPFPAQTALTPAAPSLVTVPFGVVFPLRNWNPAGAMCRMEVMYRPRFRKPPAFEFSQMLDR